MNMVTKKKTEEKPQLLTVIPKGDPNSFSVMYADSFDKVYTNGTTGYDGTLVPDQEMIDRMQQNIVIALHKLTEYQAELLQAHKVLSKVVPHESYAKLEEEMAAKKLKM